MVCVYDHILSLQCAMLVYSLAAPVRAEITASSSFESYIYMLTIVVCRCPTGPAECYGEFGGVGYTWSGDHYNGVYTGGGENG